MLGIGDTVVADVPKPVLIPGHILVQSQVSLVSAGAERMLVEFWQRQCFRESKAGLRIGLAIRIQNSEWHFIEFKQD